MKDGEVTMAVKIKTKEDTTIWLSTLHKCLAFHAVAGYEKICFSTQEEVWEAVKTYIDLGYLVQ